MNLILKGALITRFGTQAEAAKRLGLDETRLSRIIRGYREPNPKERKIIEGLGVKLGQEMKGQEAR
jgi:transcriptional regulator with XRE-family HTH domain